VSGSNLGQHTGYSDKVFLALVSLSRHIASQYTNSGMTAYFQILSIHYSLNRLSFDGILTEMLIASLNKSQTKINTIGKDVLHNAVQNLPTDSLKFNKAYSKIGTMKFELVKVSHMEL
jgi:hypothetical protein